MSTTRPEDDKKAKEPSTQPSSEYEEKKKREADEQNKRNAEAKVWNEFLASVVPHLQKVEDAPIYKKAGKEEEEKASNIEVNEQAPKVSSALIEAGFYTANDRTSMRVDEKGCVTAEVTEAEFNKNPNKYMGEMLDFLKYNGGSEVASLSFTNLTDPNSRNHDLNAHHLMVFMDEAEKRGMKVEFGQDVLARLDEAKYKDQDLFRRGREREGKGFENYNLIMGRMQEVNAKYEAKQPATKALIDETRITKEMKAETTLPAAAADKKTAIDNLFKNADGTDMTTQQQIDKVHAELAKVEERLQRASKAMTLLTDQESNAAKDPKLESVLYEKGKALHDALKVEVADVNERKALLEKEVARIDKMPPAPPAEPAKAAKDEAKTSVEVEKDPKPSAPPAEPDKSAKEESKAEKKESKSEEAKPASQEPKTMADVQKKLGNTNELMDKMNKAQSKMEKGISDFANKVDTPANNRNPQP